MVRKLLNWTGAQGDWCDSDFVLPALDPEADVMLQRWCAVAGGLALILSRVSPTERSARFTCTQALYVQVRDRLRQQQPVNASPELLGEVAHEIADVADPLTRACLKSCFQASLRPGASGDTAPMALADVRTSLPASSVPPAPRASRAPAPSTDHGATSLLPEALVERSAALRRTLAAARCTGAPQGK